MSKSARLSDELFEQAREKSVVYHRSPPQQIEHWAPIGSVMESALSYGTMNQVKVEATTEQLDQALSLPGGADGKAIAHHVIQKTSFRHQKGA